MSRPDASDAVACARRAGWDEAVTAAGAIAKNIRAGEDWRGPAHLQDLVYAVYERVASKDMARIESHLERVRGLERTVIDQAQTIRRLKEGAR